MAVRASLIPKLLKHTTVGLLLLGVSGLASAESRPEPSWRLVNYWSEWCSPCRKEIPMLNALSKELEDHGVAVLGVNFDDDPREATLQIAKSLGIEFPTLTASEVDALRLQAPPVMPTTYLLTPDNSVAARLIGLQSREQIVAQLARFGLLEAAP